jgi:hypothetical protein
LTPLDTYAVPTGEWSKGYKIQSSLAPEHYISAHDQSYTFLDCFEKSSKGIKLLLNDTGKVMFSTGATMKDTLEEHYPGITVQKTSPTHKNNLANIFHLYADFDTDKYL